MSSNTFGQYEEQQLKNLDICSSYKDIFTFHLQINEYHDPSHHYGNKTAFIKISPLIPGFKDISKIPITA